MKVLYFSRDYTPHDYRFLSAIHAIGHQVSYLRLTDARRNLENRALPVGVEIIDWQWGKGQFEESEADVVRAALQQIARQIKPDVVHSGPLPDCSWLVAEAGLHPHVAMSWGFDLMHDIHVDPQAKERSRVALEQADWFLGDCFVERDTAAELGLNPRHATIFPWGINPAVVKAGPSKMRTKLADENDFLMISTRSLEPNYDVATTLQAFLIAAAQEPALKMLILADGSQKEKLHAIAAAADSAIQQRIIWIERVPNPEIVDYYRSADLYISSSITDGSSVSLLEAQACELPVLVSAIPGNREWVQEGVTGFLFETGNIAQLAEKMLWCYRNRDKMGAVRAAARRQIETRADWDKNKFRLNEAYEQAIAVWKSKGK
ncbi:MAG: glycosyltransferase family 4 protein [Chloroflexi bacterium]|nr:glycosyltransferase family 4 protein [Chloroflexota bacterium]